MATQAWCPDCKAELPQEYLKYPIMGCPRCKRVIHYPDFRAPLPPAFEQFDRVARQAAVRLTHAWERGSAKKRAEIVNKLKSLAQDLESV